jgi:hypothetical protein
MTFLEYAAVERRATPRHSVLRAGTILIGNGSTNCMARNMSIAGAMLGVTSSDGIPEDFTLILASGGRYMPCRVMWRQQRRIGIKTVVGQIDWGMPNVGDKIPIVEVIAPDGSKSLWAAAVAPENAVAVVAMLVPASHVATLLRRRLTLNRRLDELRPGEVRRVRL